MLWALQWLGIFESAIILIARNIGVHPLMWTCSLPSSQDLAIYLHAPTAEGHSEVADRRQCQDQSSQVCGGYVTRYLTGAHKPTLAPEPYSFRTGVSLLVYAAKYFLIWMFQPAWQHSLALGH